MTRLTIREKARLRDGNGPWLRPTPGVFFTVEHFGWPGERVLETRRPSEEGRGAAGATKPRDGNGFPPKDLV